MLYEKRVLRPFATLVFALGWPIVTPAQGTGIPAGDWWTIDRDPAGTRYSPLDQINRDNVAGLTEIWRYDLGGSTTAVPLAVGGVVYMAAGNRVLALDGVTGAELWSASPPAGSARGGRGGASARVSSRGISYWPGNTDHEPRLLFMSGQNLVAIGARDGLPIADFGTGGSVAVTPSFGGVPTIAGNVAVLGATAGEQPRGPAGNPRAFNVITGAPLWEFRTVPQPGEPYSDTWGDDGWQQRSGTNMWAFAATVDTEREIVYLPISSPATNYYGGDRPGSNVYSDSIVAVHARTGAYLWHFQTVHHDIWDVDVANAGTLFEFSAGGESRPAIAYVGKASYVFVLDRETGEPLIDIEERPVPAGDVPGEYYHPTQPFPVRPPPLARVSFDVATDLVRPEDTSPAHAAACLELIEQAGGLYNEGPFTPFLYRGSDDPPRSAIQFPGGTGGVNWGGSALDPATGLIFVNTHDAALTGWVEDRKPGVDYGRSEIGVDSPFARASIEGPGPYSSFTAPYGGFDDEGNAIGSSLPCQRPPWAQLVAVDVNRGEIVWRSVLGLHEAMPDDRQRVGNSNSAGPTVSGGGLVFIGATPDARFRAFDTDTGEELWVTALEGEANANPMLFADGRGRQRVAINAGGYLMVYGLPDPE